MYRSADKHELHDLRLETHLGVIEPPQDVLQIRVLSELRPSNSVELLLDRRFRYG